VASAAGSQQNVQPPPLLMRTLREGCFLYITFIVLSDFSLCSNNNFSIFIAAADVLRLKDFRCFFNNKKDDDDDDER